MIDCYCQKHVAEAIRKITSEILFKATDSWGDKSDITRRAVVAKLQYTAQCAHRGKRRCRKVAEFLVMKL